MFFIATWVTWVGLSGPVQAANYELKDPQILGLYKLAKADKEAEVKTAELIYNNDNKLVVRTSEDLEYELSGPDKSGVIYDGNDDPNCGGEEEKCWYDSHTVIRLVQAKVAGELIPQLMIQITKSNAWDEEGKDDYTTTSVLNWSKELDYAIPYYVNIDVPPELQSLTENCRRELKDLDYEEGASYLNVSDICPYPFTVQLREPVNKALAYLFKDLLSMRSKPKVGKLTAQQLRTQVFSKARGLAKKYKPEDPKSPTSADVLAQLDKIEAYAVKADEIYTYRFLRDANLVLVDSKAKTVSRFNIRVERDYKD